LTGYNAGPGYDLASGWGSVDAYVLAHGWASGTTGPAPLKITSSSPLNPGQTGTFYSQTLSATGGTPPYSWAVANGNLPPGLALSTGGVLGGTPSLSGTYNFTVQVTDSAHGTASLAAAITITGTTSGAGASPTANIYHVFPQFADGALENGSFYRTTLMISNPSGTTAASCTLRLRGLTVPGFNLNYSIAASGWVIASTSGTQSFQSGYATLQCSSLVEAQLLYSYYDASGVKLSEATVFSSPPATSVQVLGDNRGGAQIAIAVANDSDQSGTYTISAYDNTGQLMGFATQTLAARSNYATFVKDLIALPPGFYGQITVSGGTSSASLIGLRYTGSAFTTIPGITRSSLSPTAGTYHIFPQFTDGQLSDGSYYRTTVLITNASNSSGACTLHLYGLTVNGANVVTFPSAAPGGWIADSSISSMQSIKSGYATLSCPMAVEAQFLYSYYSSVGTKISEATVFSSPVLSTPQLLADNRQGSKIALAIANDSDQAATYTIAPYDASGAQVSTITRQIAARGSMAAFLSDLFPAFPVGYYGKVLVTSAGGTASIIGLRFTGSTFTTIPETTTPALPPPVSIPTPAPVLTSITPSSGTAGTALIATLAGANFVSGATTVTVSGAGITLGLPQVASTNSLSISLTIDAAASPGNRTIAVTTSGGTSDGLTFNVLAATASKPFNQTQTERLTGTWNFSWTISSTFTETFKLKDVEASTVTAGEWNIFGADQYGGLVIAGYSTLLKEFVLYDPGTVIDEFFVFDFMGTDTVAGCYYLISPPGSTNLSSCYPMTGRRTSASAITSALRDPSIRQRAGDYKRHKKGTQKAQKNQSSD
jgi:hypothetical protein